MNVPLRPDQDAWLKAQVASGRFRTLEEAIAGAVAGLRARELADDTWVRKGESLEKLKASLSQSRSPSSSVRGMSGT
jgi:Arc/MetJ-type ribon-helix-helix transcriptional regulator